MARRLRIAVVEAAGYTPVGSVAATTTSHRELDALVRRHLPPAAATLFAEPRPSADGREVAWYSDLAGQPVPLVSLPAAERAAAEERLTTRLTALDGLAERLRARSPAEAARLDDALRYPGDDSVWVVGGEPVLAFWGHQAIGRPPLGPPRVLAPPPPPVVTPVVAPPERRGGAGRSIGWSLLTLLVLAALGYGLWRGLGWGWWWPPWGPDYAALVAQARREQRALAAELAALEAGLGERLAGCAADAALAAARTEGARLEGVASALAERVAAAVRACPPPEVTKPPEVRPPDPEPVAKKPRQPKPAEPQPKELVVPKEAAKTGSVDFVAGKWRVHQREADGTLNPTRVAALDRTPLVADFEFDAKGRGTRIISLDDGDRCTSSARATMRGGRLRVEAAVANCRSGKRSFNPATLECAPASPSQPAQCWEKEPGVPDDDVWLVRVQ